MRRTSSQPTPYPLSHRTGTQDRGSVSVGQRGVAEPYAGDSECFGDRGVAVEGATGRPRLGEGVTRHRANVRNQRVVLTSGAGTQTWKDTRAATRL